MFTKITNYIENSDETKKLLPDLKELGIIGHVDGINGYPLNLLTDLSLLIYSGIGVLFIVCYIYVYNYINTKGPENLFPKWLYGNTNLFTKVFKFILDRNIKAWSGISSYLLIFCWFLLLFILVTFSSSSSSFPSSSLELNSYS